MRTPKKIIFFGAGIIGKTTLNLWRAYGLEISFFADNSELKVGTKVENILVISIDQLRQLTGDTEIYITCKEAEVIFEQLVDAGIEKDKIRIGNSIVKMLRYAMSQPEFKILETLPLNVTNDLKPNILFDLENGLVLGGVETWSINNAIKLGKLGYTVGFLVNFTQSHMQQLYLNEIKELVIPLKYCKEMTYWENLNNIVTKMLCANKNYVICNFVGMHFTAACLAKKIFPDKVKVIVVIHNDETIYYEYYKLFSQYIDWCLVISQKISDTLLRYDFPREKILYLPSVVLCEEKFCHIYTSREEPIRLGYAGRIVVKQKRLDYLITIAKKLKEQGVNFLLEIVGTGLYEEELKEQIRDNMLEKEVHFLGFLEQTQYDNFWKKQDIMISCSDFEGHSGTQVEAMASGAVPVCTDVSGVRDDIVDGENGFIVQVGEVDLIVERVCFLYEHREKLAEMGERAYQSIRERNNEKALENLWQKILQ